MLWLSRRSQSGLHGEGSGAARGAGWGAGGMGGARGPMSCDATRMDVCP